MSTPRLLAGSCLWLACACGGGGTSPLAVAFPHGFLWGTATAGFQVEMGCPSVSPGICEDSHSDWYRFITAPETRSSSTAFLKGDPPGAGPGHYELYDADFGRAAGELANNAHRLSLEWSRIFPRATDEVESFEELRSLADDRALIHYHDVLLSLRHHGLEPFVTLDHYTLPVWIHDAVGCHLDLDRCSPKGWVDRDRTVREIAKFAGFAAREFGSDVDYWITENEPLAVFYPGYLYPSTERSNPPAVFLRTAEAKTTIFAMIDAHARMVDAIRANDTLDADGDGRPNQVGLVYALSPTYPKVSGDSGDELAARNVDYLYNQVFLRAVALGELDEDLDGTSEPREDLIGRMDFLGINYYNRIIVEKFFVDGVAVLPGLSPLTTFNPLTVEFDRDYPRGLYEAVLAARDAYHLPMFVTENGAPVAEGYPSQESFLVRCLGWLGRAIDGGADVRGYFYWSLMDNYEWNHGTDLRFGLYAVDPTDRAKTRVARPSASLYGEIARRGGVSQQRLARYPID